MSIFTPENIRAFFTALRSSQVSTRATRVRRRTRGGDELDQLLRDVAQHDPTLGTTNPLLLAWKRQQPIVRVLAGDGQTAESGKPVATPPSVSVSDGANTGIGGVLVRFVVTAGNGRVRGGRKSTTTSSFSTGSGSVGVASAAVGEWVLGDEGDNELTAVVGAQTVRFRARATKPPAPIPPVIYAATPSNVATIPTGATTGTTSPSTAAASPPPASGKSAPRTEK